MIEEACSIVAEILDKLEEFIKPGISTEDINNFCENIMHKKGAIAAAKGYRGFPKAVCTSVNNQVAHSIPSPTQILKDGDIISVDSAVIFKGWYGDACRTYFVGTPKHERLVKTAYETMWSAINIVKNGVSVGDLGYAMEQTALKEGFSTVRYFVGHGVGRNFHEDPQIPFWGKKGRGEILRTGKCFTIEPMVNEGNYNIYILEDGWTAVTVDGKMSAQFEHTIRVLKTGYDVLTFSNFDAKNNKQKSLI